MDISEKVFKDNPSHRPMVECDYFLWLKEKKKDNIHGIETKVEYLTEKYGYVRGTDTLNQKTLSNLKMIERFYFDFWAGKGLR